MRIEQVLGQSYDCMITGLQTPWEPMKESGSVVCELHSCFAKKSIIATTNLFYYYFPISNKISELTVKNQNPVCLFIIVVVMT